MIQERKGLGGAKGEEQGFSVGDVMSYDVMSYYVMLCDVMSYDVMSCDVM